MESNAEFFCERFYPIGNTLFGIYHSTLKMFSTVSGKCLTVSQALNPQSHILSVLADRVVLVSQDEDKIKLQSIIGSMNEFILDNISKEDNEKIKDKLRLFIDLTETQKRVTGQRSMSHNSAIELMSDSGVIPIPAPLISDPCDLFNYCLSEKEKEKPVDIVPSEESTPMSLYIMLIEEPVDGMIKDRVLNQPAIFRGGVPTTFEMRPNEPLEWEDKWSRKIPKAIGLKMSGKEFLEINKGWFHQNGSEIELWLQTEKEDAVLFASENGSIAFGFKTGKIFVNNSGRNVYSDISNTAAVQIHKWTNLLFRIVSENSVEIFVNSKKLASIPVKLKIAKLAKEKLLIFPVYEGNVAEVRLFSALRALNEISDDWRTPLPKVFEEAGAIKIVIKSRQQRISRISQNDPTFLPSLPEERVSRAIEPSLNKHQERKSQTGTEVPRSGSRKPSSQDNSLPEPRAGKQKNNEYF